ncbi:MAG: glycosyltransferase involved in cell wall biosynthesis [Candidatus Azotimanducaceae bacterium]|jgi:glycosyltransferase involved in cell wall biosynthesis
MNTVDFEKKPVEVMAVVTSKLSISRGTPMRILKLLKGLADRPDIRLRVVSPDDENPVPGAEHVQVQDGFFKMLPVIRKSLRGKDCDVVIGHTLGSIRQLFVLRFISKGKLLLEMHGFIAEEGLLAGTIGYVRYRVNTMIHKFFFWWCDMVTTCGPTATDIIAQYNANTHTVYNGADVALFSPDADAAYDFKSAPDDIVIGYAGNSSSYQGLDFLFDAFDKLSKNDPRYHLALLISGNYDESKANTKIHIVKGVPHQQVPSFLKSCDLLVVPRPANEVTRISFASKLLEYISMGIPVISSSTSDADKVITSGVDGVLYPPGDEASFIAALKHLSDPSVRANMGSKGRNLVCSTYKNSDTHHDFYTLIKQLSKK